MPSLKSPSSQPSPACGRGSGWHQYWPLRLNLVPWGSVSISIWKRTHFDLLLLVVFPTIHTLDTTMKCMLRFFAAPLLFSIAFPAYSGEDLFSGKYSFPRTQQGESLLIKPTTDGRWNIFSVDQNSNITPFPVPGMPPMHLATGDQISRIFDSESPRNGIRCLVWPRENQSPILCSIPTNSSYQVSESIAPNRRFVNKTGYIIIVGTAAGMLPSDVTRGPP